MLSPWRTRVDVLSIGGTAVNQLLFQSVVHTLQVLMRWCSMVASRTMQHRADWSVPESIAFWESR
jgi:hypothetical protein